MKPVPVFLAAWTLSGVGALIGSIIGSAAGKFGLFTGAVLGGVLGVAVAVGAVAKLHWLSPEERGGALVGGILGFGVAAPIAATHLHTPVTPILICGLAGLGVLLGVRVARSWR